jgi:membrane protein YdbS with pleckstrin-like domain
MKVCVRAGEVCRPNNCLSSCSRRRNCRILGLKDAREPGGVVLMMSEPVPDRIRALERPHPALWTYYIIIAICTLPGMVVMLPYLYFRYHTLRYRFDEEGIHMKVGILFRRETNLTYARIQDIHLRSGVLQRWLGLANVQVQTASGSSGPELVIEGFKEYEAIRDFLYTRMRGYQVRQSVPRPAAVQAPPSTAEGHDLVPLLLGIRDELRRTRELLEARSPASPSQQPPALQSQPPRNV